MYSVFLKNSVLKILVLAALSVGIVLPIAIQGIPLGNDISQHYQFAAVYREHLAAGDIFPPWTTSSNSGLGDLGIRLYPPLSHYLLAFVHLLVGDWYWASVISFCLLFFLG